MAAYNPLIYIIIIIIIIIIIMIIIIITSFEKPLVLLVCKIIDLNLSQMNQHTSALLL
jgi:hypothetical protein